MSGLPFAVTTPLRVGKVGLKARDAEALAQYYRDVVGLIERNRQDCTIILGTSTHDLLEIEQDSSLKPERSDSAGLFHTAFLLPERADLARWLRRAIDQRIAISGASDHAVSEAVYLNDPEGNGIEIYVDRPHQQWKWHGSEVEMTTDALDIKDLLEQASDNSTVWSEAPENTVVGHVHLRVGNAAQAERWWHNELGLDTVAHYGSKAVFMSSGGYHHHIAANEWQSAGAGKRDAGHTGLAFVELHDSRDGINRTISDPWGNEIRILKV